MKKQILAGLLSLGILVGWAPDTAASSYQDVKKEAFYYEAVEDLKKAKILTTPGPLLKPLEPIARQEAAQIISQSIDVLAITKPTYQMTPFYFKDVKVNDAFYPHAIKMHAYGIMQGTHPNEFGTKSFLTRAQAVKILTETFQVPTTTSRHYYTDVPKGAAYAKYVNTLHEYGVVKGSNGKFMPTQKLTRGQWLAMVKRMKDWQTESKQSYDGKPLVNHPNQMMLHQTKVVQSSWKKYRPVDPELIYTQVPHIQAPYRPGSITPAFSRDALHATQFVRSIAGLSTELTIDPIFQKDAQAAALVLAVNNEGLSHYPQHIANMDAKLFKQGYEGAGTSNIAYGYWSIADSILYGYMADEDDVNREDVGHRRWILNPHLKRVGFGFAVSEQKNRPYSVMKIVDAEEQRMAQPPNYITWPTQGAFPYEFLKYPTSKNTIPWSISLSTQAFKTPQVKEVSVVLKRIRDGRQWKFNEKQQDGFFTIQTDNYGHVGPTLIFQPTHAIYPMVKGDVFEVTVEGLKDKQGNRQSIRYTTMLVDLEK